MEIIGESLNLAAKDADSLQGIIPELPRIVGLRNRLIHGYDTVDPEIVWDVVKHKIPQLLVQLKNACDHYDA